MGIEYLARMPPGQETLNLSSLFAQLHAQAEWTVCDQTPTRILLRFSEQPERSSWLEDLLIERVDEGLYVLFHCGTAAQRRRLLTLLEALSRKQGIIIAFEEL